MKGTISLNEFFELSAEEKGEAYARLSDQDQFKARLQDDPGVSEIMCNYCIHRYQGVKCKAFPERIPSGLLVRGEHNTPYPGDQGIRFEKHPNNT